MPTDQLLLFIAAGLLLNLTPGPDVLYVVSHALRSGARAGMVAALGITAGCFVHIFAAAVGVSALMAASATAFALLKWAGAAYLVYVGLRLLRPGPAGVVNLDAAPDDAAQPQDASAYRAIFLRGFWTNALNPKVALFFLAFVPQFITPQMDNKPLAFLLLGLLFNFNGLWVNVGWAAAAAFLARRSGLVQRSLRWLDRAAGALFVGFGIRLALTAAPQP
jgi:threonine/homoserine/homoserine lactone efflux protein